MWQRFTERARRVVFHAQEEAGRWGKNSVGPEHLLLGLIRDNENKAARILDELGVSQKSLQKEIEARLTRGKGRLGQDMQLTPHAKRVIDLAYDEARKLKHNYIGTEHLLLGLLREKNGIALEVLTELGVTLENVRDQLQQMQDGGEALDEVVKPRTGFESFTAKFSVMKGVSDDKKLEETRSQEELLSLDEAVKFLGTSKPTLYRLLGQDEIKGLKVGRQWRFRKTDLIAYMERSPVAVSAAPTEDLDMELAFFAEQLGQNSAQANIDAESKTVRLAQEIIKLAIQSRASDIHLEPTQNDFLLRYRVDGVLQETRRLPSRMKESLTAQIKTMAEMNLSETRMPQEGHIPVKHGDKDFDLWVSTIPTVHGEAATLRILDRSNVLIGLDKLGIVPEDLMQIRDFLSQPNGIVLATGPTGSGKTTLLYSCLQAVASIERKTLTIEDPVEFMLTNTTQVAVNKKAGLTFAAALRSFLKQDPDILLASEMRDLETAQILVEAALTGHLVLSSLHTNDAPSALLRLVEMGIEPYLVSATVTGIVATRRCRRVCESCKTPADLSGEPIFSYIRQLTAEGGYEIPSDAVFYKGQGCEQCRGRGYQGRLGLYEVLPMTEMLTEALLRRASAEEMTALAIAGGMRTLLADGIRKAAAGLTTVDEVLRVASVSI